MQANVTATANANRQSLSLVKFHPSKTSQLLEIRTLPCNTKDTDTEVADIRRDMSEVSQTSSDSATESSGPEFCCEKNEHKNDAEKCLKTRACLKYDHSKDSTPGAGSDDDCSSSTCSSKSEVCAKSDNQVSVSCSDNSGELGSVDSHISTQAASASTESAHADSSADLGSKNEDSKNKSVTTHEVSGPSEDKSTWSISEDALLRAMKEANDGLSWVDIGTSLNRTKGDCKARWKAIKDLPTPITTDLETNTEASASVANKEEPTEKGVDQETGETKAAPDPQTGDRDDSIPTGPEASQLLQYQQQREYWREHIASHLYPDSVQIDPDGYFSKSDCDVLRLADAQYRSMRWLEVQARFYNETGRMVPLEVIRKKCGHGSNRTHADIADWVNGVGT